MFKYLSIDSMVTSMGTAMVGSYVGNCNHTSSMNKIIQRRITNTRTRHCWNNYIKQFNQTAVFPPPGIGGDGSIVPTNTD